MLLTLAWDNRNRILQADVPIAYDDGDTGREAGQLSCVEWRFRADVGDTWGPPTIYATAGNSATYTPPGDGWVHITLYSLRDNLSSWQWHRGVVRVFGGAIVLPRERGRYVNQNGDPYVNQNGDYYEG